MKALPLFLIAAVFALTSCGESTPVAETPAVEETPVETAATAPAPEEVPAPEVAAAPRVRISTSLGDMVVELNAEKAPGTVENFLGYVKDGFYNNTVFHRVIEGFMIQGGGFALLEDGKIQQKETKSPIQNEAQNGLKNARGTISMARTGDPHSATAQFFINHGENNNLDYPSFDGWGYAVFGEVVEGLEVMDQIAAVQTGTQQLITKGGPAPMQDVPMETVVIKSISAL